MLPIDNEFVVSFIQECSANDATTPEQICQTAISRIEEIDAHLKIRNKYNDVLRFFKYKKKDQISNKELSFDNIDHLIAGKILDILRDNSLTKEELIENFLINKRDAIFVVKKLLENDVININVDNKLIFSSNFDRFNEIL